jgi:hypothetical protein
MNAITASVGSGAAKRVWQSTERKGALLDPSTSALKARCRRLGRYSRHPCHGFERARQLTITRAGIGCRPTDGHGTYAPAAVQLKAKGALAEACQHRVGDTSITWWNRITAPSSAG